MRYFIFVLILFLSPLLVFAQNASDIDTSDNGHDLQQVINTLDQESGAISQPEDLPSNEYMRGYIKEIINEDQRDVSGNYVEKYQLLQVEITSGIDKGKKVNIENSGIENLDNIKIYSAGDRIVVVRISDIDGNLNYFLADSYRLNALFFIFGVFILLVLWLAKTKGLGSLLGLGFSILVLVRYIVPQIAKGNNPIIVTLIGSLIIMLVSLYLAHGFNHKTTLSLFSTFITLAISVGLASLFVHWANLLGLGSEEAFYLQTGQFGKINLQGLLLAGILIGTLGVLDDITTAQTAIVGELRLANKDLPKSELYKRSLVVGKEHISSLVNTLVLAYAGASLPLFLLFSSSSSPNPMWYTINSEFVAEEIVRTLVGSIGLVLAVPISSYIAAHFLSKKDLADLTQSSHPHSHSHSH